LAFLAGRIGSPRSSADLPAWIEDARELLRGQEDQPIEEAAVALRVRKDFLNHLERLCPGQWPEWYRLFQPDRFQKVRELAAMTAAIRNQLATVEAQIEAW
jgi:hypothetical protein